MLWPYRPLSVPLLEETVFLFSIGDLRAVGQITLKRFYHCMSLIRYYAVLYFMRDGGGTGSKIL